MEEMPNSRRGSTANSNEPVEVILPTNTKMAWFAPNPKHVTVIIVVLVILFIVVYVAIRTPQLQQQRLRQQNIGQY